MAGINVKDTTPASLTQAATRFTDRFNHTFEAVATRPLASWQGLQRDDIKALLGILGLPFQATAAKPALLDQVSIAQRLAVYQGLLIPQIIQPFTHIRLPDPTLLDMATESFIGSFAVALEDQTHPLPPPHEYKGFILDYQGQMVDLSEFDMSLWSMLPSPVDRRLFLSMFGIPFEKTVALDADDLLPLLPKDLMSLVPVVKGNQAVMTSAKRTRMLHHIAAVSQTPVPSATGPSQPGTPNPGTTQRSPRGSSPLPLSPASQASPMGPNPLTVFPGATHFPPYPAFTPIQPRVLPQMMGTAATAALPGFTPGGSAQTGPMRVRSQAGAHDLGVRSFVHPQGHHIEASRADLAALDVPTLLQWIAMLDGTNPSQVPFLPVQAMVNRIWQSSSTPSFRTLLQRSPDCAADHGYILTHVCWPNPSLTQIMLVAERFGQPVEATYRVDQSGNVYAPAMAHLVTGDTSVFPPVGQVEYGDTALVPNVVRNTMQPTTTMTGPSAAAMPSATTSQLHAMTAVSESINKSQRSAKNGTRMLKDEVVDSTFLSLVSATPTDSGNTMFYNALYLQLVKHKHYIQCPLRVLVELARSFADHNPNHFVPLTSCMDATTAQKTASVFLKSEYRNENKFTGTVTTWWNNQPDTLYQTLLSLFRMANALFNYHPTIYDELKLVAQRMHMIACTIPDRPIENNEYFWGEVTNQVNDVFLGASAVHTTVLEIVTALRAIPNFTTDQAAHEQLRIIHQEAHRKLRAGTASQLTVYAKEKMYLSANPTIEQPATVTTIRTSPRRTLGRVDDDRDRPRGSRPPPAHKRPRLRKRFSGAFDTSFVSHGPSISGGYESLYDDEARQ